MSKKYDEFLEPDWVRDDKPPRTEPYTDEELDLFVEGFIQGHGDTPVWTSLVDEHGEAKVRLIIREGFRSQGPSSLDKPPNLN